jgi:hypothetical protein
MELLLAASDANPIDRVELYWQIIERDHDIDLCGPILVAALKLKLFKLALHRRVLCPSMGHKRPSRLGVTAASGAGGRHTPPYSFSHILYNILPWAIFSPPLPSLAGFRSLQVTNLVMALT